MRSWAVEDGQEHLPSVAVVFEPGQWRKRKDRRLDVVDEFSLASADIEVEHAKLREVDDRWVGERCVRVGKRDVAVNHLKPPQPREMSILEEWE